MTAGVTSPGARPAVSLGSAAPPFFAVTQTKLLVMSLLTFSLYEFYWFYKNWQIEKQRERPEIMPFWRASFAFFFCYGLFRRVDERAATHRLKSIAAGWLAAGWIMAILVGQFPQPYLFANLLTVFFLLPVQRAANGVNALEAPDHDPNGRFTLWNLMVIALVLTIEVLAYLALKTLDSLL